MSTRRKDIAMLLASRIAAAGQVTTLAGLRIRPDVLETNEKLPAVTYMVIASEHWGHLHGSSGEAQSRVEFRCYSHTRQEARQVAYAIRDVLNGFAGLLEDDANDPENTNVSRVYDCTPDNDYVLQSPESPGSNAWRYCAVIDFEVSHTEPVPSLVLE